ncbi:MAG: cbb3-type cytochrome oxidase assembly protein CcoS [Planctomycetia bacterium]|nr:cbb3-type cytochrome oxidase assembly protein CcoS [Planctomycetia bacterium]
MSVIYIALPVALLLVLAAFLAFRWCIQTGQFDHLENASYRMLHDDGARKRVRSVEKKRE